jgi:hypothetical protein
MLKCTLLVVLTAPLLVGCKSEADVSSQKYIEAMAQIMERHMNSPTNSADPLAALAKFHSMAVEVERLPTNLVTPEVLAFGKSFSEASRALSLAKNPAEGDALTARFVSVLQNMKPLAIKYGAKTPTGEDW